MNEWEQKIERRADTTWKSTIAFVWMAWVIFCVFTKFQIELENIRSSTITNPSPRTTKLIFSSFVRLFVCSFFMFPILFHIVIISFENMTYLYVDKHEFGKRRFLSWHITNISTSAYWNRWYEILFDHITNRHRTKWNQTPVMRVVFFLKKKQRREKMDQWHKMA